MNGPKRYRKKPVVIEALQWTGDWEPVREFILGGGGFAHVAGEELLIETEEGVMHASPGDWIIKGVASEFYPCKPDIFEATYEDADPLAQVEAAGESIAAAREAMRREGFTR